LKVIHVITKLELGGAQENTLYTLGHLDPSRFSGMLVSGSEGLLVPSAERDGRYETRFIPSLVREVRPLADLGALSSLTALFKSEMKKAAAGGKRPSLIVHTHSSKAGILGRLAARMARVPVTIHSIHGYGFHDGQPLPLRSLYVALERIVARWTTHFIAVSRADVEKGLSLRLFTPGKVSLIRSGIEIDRYGGAGLDPAALKAELGVPPEGGLVVMVACLKPQKNPLDFVRLASLVAREEPETHFLLVGDGELRPEVEEAVRSAGLGERFRLLGWRRDVERIIPACDVFVLTSLWEGLPRVFPQAMAAGRPIVAYGVGGAADAVVDGENGYLVDPGDFPGAARRVIGLLREPARSRALGEAGRRRVEEFDAPLMVRRQEELYQRLQPPAGGG